MWIIYEPNGHYIRYSCEMCGGCFKLEDPTPVMYAADGEKIGDLCSDCAEAAEASGAAGIALKA